MKVCQKESCLGYGSAAHSEKNIYCYKCGERLADIKKECCGNELHHADVYCPQCGKKADV